MSDFSSQSREGAEWPDHCGADGDRAAGGFAWRLAAALDSERPAWALWTPVTIACGVLVYFGLAFEPSLAVAGGVGAGACGMAFVRRLVQGSGALAQVLMAFAILGAAGFVAAKLRTEWVRAPVIEKRTGAVVVKGFVELVEASSKRGERLTVRPYAIEALAQHELPRRVRIRVLNPREGLRPGDAVSVKARLAPPAPPAMPGAFDFARYAWFHGIGGVGYALARPVAETMAPPRPWWLEAKAEIARVRHEITQRVYRALPGQTGAIAAALVTGERGAISAETNQVYRDAGLFHILSISGMHMAIMAGTVFLLARVLFAALPGIALRYPVKKWSALIAALGALGYLLISGMAFATVRSYIMISVMFFAILIDRPALALRNVALAATVLLLLFPESILDPGFQMSFAAVTALIAGYEFLRKRRAGRAGLETGMVAKALLLTGGIIVSTLIASLAVAPIAAYHFQTTQHFAILANVAAVPLSNLIVMPAALLALLALPLGLEAWPLYLMGAGVDMMTGIAAWIAGLPGAVAHVPAMPGIALAAIVSGGLWLLLWQKRWRLYGLPVIVVGLALTPFGDRPSLLVGNDGRDVLVRDVDGRYRVLEQRRASFEMRRWLERGGTPLKGQGTMPEPVGTARCDEAGCVAKVNGLVVAQAKHASAFIDDCASADILVIDRPRPKGCSQPGTVIDFFDVRYGGTHALYVDDHGKVTVRTVATSRGRRPWTGALPGRDRSWPVRRASGGANDSAE